jgi:P-type Ca2+ transporter type 2C
VSGDPQEGPLAAPGEAFDGAPPPALVDACRPSEAIALLGSRDGGLTGVEASERLTRFGANHLVTDPAPRLLVRFVVNMSNLMALLLWAAGILALFAALPQLAIAVWVVNLLNGAFSTWQEFRAERAVQALRKLLPHEARVLREGLETHVDAESLVPGDMLLLAEGERVSADARVVESHELRVDQSSLTGESRAVRRTAAPLAPAAVDGQTRPPAERLNAVFAGTTVSSGRGKAVVTATGMATEFGTIAGLTRATERDLSPLQRELVTVTRTVGFIAISMGLVFFALAQVMTPMPLTTGLVFALGMIVAFVPEGLLPSVTLALAMATQRMARRQALVKRLSSVETLGSTTVICTDKTGTLTANQMTVRALIVGDERYEVSGTGYDPAGTIERDGDAVAAGAELLELLRTGVLANDARIAPDPDAVATRTVIGDPTEAALLVAAEKAGLDPAEERRARPRVSELPFDAERKRMSTLHDEPAGLVLRCKGAPRELLERCTRIRSDGRDLPLDDHVRTQVLARNDELSREAMRVLAVAVRVLPAGATRWAADAGGRPHPARSRRDARSATAVGHRGGRHLPPRRYPHPHDHGRLRGHRREHRPTHRARGARRAAPHHQRGGARRARRRRAARRGAWPGPVRACHPGAEAPRGLGAAGRRRGRRRHGRRRERRAGAAPGGHRHRHGRVGTDVAREAADMVLLDDDFATIVAAVEEGRAVYANVRKFTGYIFTSNTPEVVPFVVFGLSGGSSRSRSASCTSSRWTSAPTSSRRWPWARNGPSRGPWIDRPGQRRAPHHAGAAPAVLPVAGTGTGRDRHGGLLPHLPRHGRLGRDRRTARPGARLRRGDGGGARGGRDHPDRQPVRAPDRPAIGVRDRAREQPVRVGRHRHRAGPHRGDRLPAAAPGHHRHRRVPGLAVDPAARRHPTLLAIDEGRKALLRRRDRRQEVTT